MNKKHLRYTAHINLEEVGIHGQRKLGNARVLLIGAGGLGVPVLQYLSAAGIGHIGVVDDDVIQESNLPRQVLFQEKHLGFNKADTICQLLKHNDSELTPYPIRLDKSNALELVKSYDLVSDCTDHIPTRYLINDAAVLVDKPVVYAGIHKYQAQVSVFNYKNGPTYRCLFPEKENDNQCRPCSETGVLSTTAGIAGLYQANEILKIIIGFGDVLSGKLLFLDTRTMIHNIINFKRSENLKDLAKKNFEEINSYTL